jgi:hypothetical protein
MTDYKKVTLFEGYVLILTGYTISPSNIPLLSTGVSKSDLFFAAENTPDPALRSRTISASMLINSST